MGIDLPYFVRSNKGNAHSEINHQLCESTPFDQDDSTRGRGSLRHLRSLASLECGRKDVRALRERLAGAKATAEGMTVRLELREMFQLVTVTLHALDAYASLPLAGRIDLDELGAFYRRLCALDDLYFPGPRAPSA